MGLFYRLVSLHISLPKVAGTLRVPSAVYATRGGRHTECACYFTDCEPLHPY